MSDESSSATITIRTSAKILAALTCLAKSMERPRNWVVERALSSYLETQAWQVEGIKEALASVDKGEWVSHEEVVAELDGILANQEE